MKNYKITFSSTNKTKRLFQLFPKLQNQQQKSDFNSSMQTQYLENQVKVLKGSDQPYFHKDKGKSTLIQDLQTKIQTNQTIQATTSRQNNFLMSQSLRYLHSPNSKEEKAEITVTQKNNQNKFLNLTNNFFSPKKSISLQQQCNEHQVKSQEINKYLTTFTMTYHQKSRKYMQRTIFCNKSTLRRQSEQNSGNISTKKDNNSNSSFKNNLKIVHKEVKNRKNLSEVLLDKKNQFKTLNFLDKSKIQKRNKKMNENIEAFDCDDSVHFDQFGIEDYLSLQSKQNSQKD
eukprot:TRINITY_DN4382_c0_g1_i1.p1 TRINITY_DN4382_c0_g1~~TRINITY_DN4382_c0_g1_i1.p1  ORF type:complete len:287 (-),score=37.25 TRINITY_DN4382_c0_g1_i1:8-868(-)